MEEKDKPIETQEQPKEEKTDRIEEAKIAAADMKKERLLLREENDRKERLQAEAIVSGQADAGQAPPPKPKEDTPEEYVDKVMSGDLNEKE